MDVNQRLAAALTAWTSMGKTQAEFASLCGLAPSGINRMFKGEQHPEVDTFAKILSALVDEYPQLAVDLLEAYLLDHVPAGRVPDGREWGQLVKIMVESLGSPRLKETPGPVDEFEMALARFNHRARTTKHGRNLVLNLDKWSNAGGTD